MQIYNEDDLLNIEFRKSVIEEIEGEENIARKAESYKRYEIYRDRIKKYILEQLILEMDEATVKEMQTRIATVNMYKKMVQKKARVYKNAPIRTSIDKGNQDYLMSLSELINLNSVMKKVNRYVEAFRNCAAYNKPYKNYAKDGRWSHKVDVLAPHQFDVIEDQDNPDIARAVILSHFKRSSLSSTSEDPQSRVKSGIATNFRDGDNQRQKIADSPGDKDKEYIFWSNKYHFTCDHKGEIVSIDKDGARVTSNPIAELPFTFFSKDQDGSFWSVGGEDMIDGCILINTLLTDIYFIEKVQGMGLFYLFGKNVPKTFKVGPNRAITMEVEDGDPTPQIGFASSNPPIADHMAMIEQFVAFLLSTNDLGVNAIQGKLDSSSANSGIQDIIQNSEPMTAIEDEQEQYKDKEPDLMNKANRWQGVLDGSETGLSIGFSDIGSVDNLLYTMSFEDQQHYSSENEKLDAIKKKVELGVWNKVDAMIEENPDLTRKEALKKLLEKSKENLEIAKSSMQEFIQGNTNGDTNNEETEDQSPGDTEQQEG